MSALGQKRTPDELMCDSCSAEASLTVSGTLPSLPRLLRERVADRVKTVSGMPGGPVDEFLGIAVERPALDQLEVEAARLQKSGAIPSCR